MRDLGEFTLAELRARGHGAGSAVPFVDAIWNAARWRDGRCVWWQIFYIYTRAEAEETIGSP